MGPMPVATPLTADDAVLGEIRFDAAGLVPAIIQEEGTGQVLQLS